MLLHERLREERMLSPCAILFWLLVDMQNISMEIIEQKMQKNRSTEKAQIASKLQF